MKAITINHICSYNTNKIFVYISIQKVFTSFILKIWTRAAAETPTSSEPVGLLKSCVHKRVAAIQNIWTGATRSIFIIMH